MRLPKKTKRYCPNCKKHTEQKLSQASSGHRRSVLKRGSIERARKRGRGRGYGNLGKWGSKPAVTKWKRKTKGTKKTNILYTCLTCKKSTSQREGIRVGKIQLEEKKEKER
ncbi:50S ribosomal protein L44e [Candidatus Pacearchaeota archaeon]|nr:50S ribosomal protein L44e [Candidatus Pacearchaeota archaeon]